MSGTNGTVVPKVFGPTDLGKGSSGVPAFFRCFGLATGFHGRTHQLSWAHTAGADLQPPSLHAIFASHSCVMLNRDPCASCESSKRQASDARPPLLKCTAELILALVPHEVFASAGNRVAAA